MNIDRNIVRIQRLTTGTGNLIHATGMAILRHAYEHRDPRKLTNLLAAIHKSARPEAFKVWVENAGPIVFEKGVARMDTTDNAKPWNLDAANAVPYYEATEQVGKPLTLEALLKVLDAMNKRIGKVQEGKVSIADGEDMQMFHALGARLQNVIRDMNQVVAAQPVDIEVIQAQAIAAVKADEAAKAPRKTRITLAA